jgi:hypothetical protein
MAVPGSQLAEVVGDLDGHCWRRPGMSWSRRTCLMFFSLHAVHEWRFVSVRGRRESAVQVVYAASWSWHILARAATRLPNLESASVRHPSM